jgi:hypothetical protein
MESDSNSEDEAVVAAAAHGIAVRDVAGRVRWSGGVWRVARGGVALCGWWIMVGVLGVVWICACVYVYCVLAWRESKTL